MSFIPQVVGVYQRISFSESTFFVTVGVTYAGVVREGLGWGANPQGARSKAAEEALALWRPHLPKEALEEMEKALKPLLSPSLESQGEPRKPQGGSPPVPRENNLGAAPGTSRGTDTLVKLLQKLREKGGEEALRKAYAWAGIPYEEGRLFLPPDNEGQRALYRAGRKLLEELTGKSKEPKK